MTVHDDPATPPEPEPPPLRALPWLLLGVTLALGWILLPFYGTLLWACIIALLFAPVNRWLLRGRLHGQRSTSALLTLGLAVVVVIVPFALVTAALAGEAMQVYDKLQSGEWTPALALRRAFNGLPDGVLDLFRRLGIPSFGTLERRVTAAMAQGTQLIGLRALALGQDTFAFLADLGITVYIAFFLIRDGQPLAQTLRRLIPLPATHQRELIDKFATVVRATVKGNLLVAGIQGLLGGLAFWYLGIGAATLGGVLMGFLSLLPAVGAALVWVPVAAWLFLDDAPGKALALCLWGVFVIGLVDNLLRPMLVGRDTRMPDVVIMVSTLGGMAVFGINGFVLGPVIAALFIAVWHIHAVTRGDVPR